MKKKIFCLLLLFIIPICLLFSGCNASVSKVGSQFKVGNITLIKVVEGEEFDIFVDKDTKVMYLYNVTSYEGGITVLLNADGTPMLWEGDL